MSDRDNPNGWKVTSEYWSTKTFADRYKRGIIDLNSRVQRGEVWDIPQRSLYIHSLLSGMLVYNIPHLYSKNGKVYSCVDGKQRGTTLIEYINNGFALKGILGEMVYDNDAEEWIEINNKKFSQLPICLQEKILDFQICAAIIETTTGEPVSSEIEAEFFRRANAGKAVSKADIAMSASKCTEAIKEIIGKVEYDEKGHLIGNNFFYETYGEKRFKAETLPKEIVLKAYYLLFPENLGGKSGETVCFSFTKLSQISKDALITDVEKQKLKDVFQKIYKAKKICIATYKDRAKPIIRRAMGKNVLLAYIPYIDRFNSEQQLARWFMYAFENLPEEMVDATNEGTGTLAKAKVRQAFMEKSITEFLEKVN